MDTDRITKNPNPGIICSGTGRRAGRYGGGGGRGGQWRRQEDGAIIDIE